MPNRLRLAALCCALTLASPANAGTVYTWSDLAGAAWSGDPSNTSPVAGGSLTIDFDPGALPPDSTASASAGGITIAGDTFAWLAPTLLEVTDSTDGATLDIAFTGTAGPLDPSGAPLSLAGFAGHAVSVVGTGGYHQDYGFTLASVPEPGSLAMLIPLGLIALAMAWRRPG